MNLKVLHVITTIDRGGAENYLCDLIEGLCKRGVAVSLAYLKGTGYWSNYFKNLGVPVYFLRLSKYGEIKPILLLREIIKKEQPSIIHAHLPPAELYTRLAMMGDKNTPFVISKHNIEPFCKLPGSDFLASWVIKRANAVITISKAVADFVRAKPYCVPQDKIFTIYYGLNIEPYQKIDKNLVLKLKKELSVPENVYLIGTVARLTRQKSIDTLLKAYACFVKTSSVPSKLLIVGRGELEDYLKNLVDKLGISSFVIWAGFREDIPVIMKALDLFVLPSLYEGLGRVLLEAMAAGVPIVASRIKPITEIVVKGKTGEFFEVKNDKELCDLLHKFSDENYRKLYKKEGPLIVKKYFSVDKMVEDTICVYKMVLR